MLNVGLVGKYKNNPTNSSTPEVRSVKIAEYHPLNLFKKKNFSLPFIVIKYF